MSNNLDICSSIPTAPLTSNFPSPIPAKLEVMPFNNLCVKSKSAKSISATGASAGAPFCASNLWSLIVPMLLHLRLDHYILMNMDHMRTLSRYIHFRLRPKCDFLLLYR